MKMIIVALTLLSMISCGNQLLETDSAQALNVTQEIKESDTLSASEKRDIADLCSSLQVKSQYVGFNSNKVLSFLVNRKSCIESLSESKKKVEPIEGTILQNFTSTFFSGDLAFRDIVTDRSSMLKTLCEDAGKSSQLPRYQVTGSSAKWFYIRDKDDDLCADIPVEVSTSKYFCLEVQTGSRIDSSGGKLYKINSIETLKVSHDSGDLRGFVLSRSEVSNSSCDQDELEEFSSRSQVLKSL